MSDNNIKNTEFHLSVPVHFSLKATALSHGWHECCPMSWNECGGCLQWVTRNDERAIRISVREVQRLTFEGEYKHPLYAKATGNRQQATSDTSKSRNVETSRRGVRKDSLGAPIGNWQSVTGNPESRISDLRSQNASANTRHLTVRIDGIDTGISQDTSCGERNGAVQERVLADVHRMLGLDEDLTEFYELCAEHPRLAIVPRIGGGRLIKSPTMTENIIKCLCATNINWTQAVKAINRIAQIGPHVRHFRNLTAWPTPREIVRAGEKYLVEVCRMGYRAEPIVKFCRDVDSGKFDPESLWSLAADANVSSDEILKILLTIRGIGPASAHSLLGLLGRHDRVSIDSATIAHVAAIHTNGRKPTLKKIQRIYAPYGKWKNLVYWCESWIRWETARELIREFHGDVSAAKG